MLAGNIYYGNQRGQRLESRSFSASIVLVSTFIKLILIKMRDLKCEIHAVESK
jgi:hypothetical protein